MHLPAFWIPLTALSLLTIWQQIRIFQIGRQARKREELFQIVTENAADMIALVDVKGRRLYNSPAYKRILGYSPAELSETSAFEQIHPDDRFRVLEASREARETGIGKRLEYRVRHKDGSWRVLESLASAVRDGKGQVAKLVIVNREITERKRAEQELEHNLFHDALTGLPNRRLFLDRLQHRFAPAQRQAGQSCALLLANLDQFKNFNQNMGTAAGDQLLVEIAKRISNSLRNLDPRNLDATAPHESSTAEPFLSRLGGDEFTILLNGIIDPSDALRVAQKIQTAVAGPFLLDSVEVRPSVSIGIAFRTPDHTAPEDLLKDADVAMRRAKALGGSRSEVSDEVLHSRAFGRLRLEADLRTAISEKQFCVHYQPVVHIETRRIASFEALLRWNHPEKGLISPYRFLDTAEDSGLLITIGHWLLLQACQQLRDWDREKLSVEPVHLTLNLSARQFADPRLADDMRDTLRQAGLDPSRLHVEVPEAVAAGDAKLTLTVLSHLKHQGMGVILDNFGAGSASLRSLWEFPMDALKIDSSLIRQLPTERTASDLVEMILALARKRNLKVIAEGLESASLAERMRQLGCEFGQGYYFSQPLDPPAALQFLQKQPARSMTTATKAT
jgi:PAS domain S-box-containing protein